MANKLIISLPCSIRELKAKLDNFDKYDIVVCQYDGNGDSLFVVPVLEENEKRTLVEAEQEIVQKLESVPSVKTPPTRCKHFLGVHCNNPIVVHGDMIPGGSRCLTPLICPFDNASECRGFEEKTDSVRQTNEFVQHLEAAHKATDGSQLVFK